ncbi:hypothetical protein EYC80_001249 [Monilinia laxa]|uniref:Uncharacterized protein n=1 Tax=Monilinia laxa TaxID=61186 RepID=A0A5N6K8U8_MONLA|nr:hypothetical protein EYC80_001249 [Monilinia laxa]
MISNDTFPATGKRCLSLKVGGFWDLYLAEGVIDGASSLVRLLCLYPGTFSSVTFRKWYRPKEHALATMSYGERTIHGLVDHFL